MYAIRSYYAEKAFFYFEGTKWIKLSTTGNTVQMPVDTVDVSGNFQAILLKIKGDSRNNFV